MLLLLLLPALASAAEYVALDITSATTVGPHAFEQARYPRDNGLNDLGQVVGLCWPGTNDVGADAASRPFFFDRRGNTVSNLGDLENDEGFDVDQSYSAYDINESGWVVGGSGNFSYSLPFIWYDADTNGYRDEDEMFELDVNDGDSRGSAQAVNNDGYVLISGDYSLCRAQFVYTNGYFMEVGDRTALHTGASITSFAMNENGDACWSVSGSGGYRGYRWVDRNDNSVAESNEIAVIESPWGVSYAQASGMNDAGHVCGNAKDLNNALKKRGFLWIDSNTNDVAEAAEFLALTSDYLVWLIYPKDINNHDAIVGAAASGSDRFAFIWDAERGFRDLNETFALTHDTWGIYEARQPYAINHFGEIAVEGRYSNEGTATYAALLTPRPSIEGAAVSGTDFELGMAGLTLGTTTSVQRCEVLASNTWGHVGGLVPAAPTTNWSGSVSGSPAFYRLETEALP